ncbi:hypothetical protein DPEC_G00307260 [Dallia pectoralis]|uniref:Uncharacterized protein n=1 Tax=Dallia pectoralis TaxID=75939 RepID=A0ACC2FED5_DALPE|nr:hypothetical protein DPEC_G00307260 [Dallia pectoralis]
MRRRPSGAAGDCHSCSVRPEWWTAGIKELAEQSTQEEGWRIRSETGNALGSSYWGLVYTRPANTIQGKLEELSHTSPSVHSPCLGTDCFSAEPGILSFVNTLATHFSS